MARFGRLIEKRKGVQYGILYDTLVNTVRAEVPPAVFIAAKVSSISNTAMRQTIVLTTGERIAARLVVLANGLNLGLRQSVGIERKVTKPGPFCFGWLRHQAGRSRRLRL